jgi:hypothetical protein
MRFCLRLVAPLNHRHRAQNRLTPPLETNYLQKPYQKVFTTSKVPFRISFLFCKGGIAQLGERLHGMQEVSGSIPLTSTTEQNEACRTSGSIGKKLHKIQKVVYNVVLRC